MSGGGAGVNSGSKLGSTRSLWSIRGVEWSRGVLYLPNMAFSTARTPLCSVCELSLGCAARDGSLCVQWSTSRKGGQVWSKSRDGSGVSVLVRAYWHRRRTPCSALVPVSKNRMTAPMFGWILPRRYPRSGSPSRPRFVSHNPSRHRFSTFSPVFTTSRVRP